MKMRLANLALILPLVISPAVLFAQGGSYQGVACGDSYWCCTMYYDCEFLPGPCPVGEEQMNYLDVASLLFRNCNKYDPNSTCSDNTLHECCRWAGYNDAACATQRVCTGSIYQWGC